jgi:hypothetical protein
MIFAIWNQDGIWNLKSGWYLWNVDGICHLWNLIPNWGGIYYPESGWYYSSGIDMVFVIWNQDGICNVFIICNLDGIHHLDSGWYLSSEIMMVFVILNLNDIWHLKSGWYLSSEIRMIFVILIKSGWYSQNLVGIPHMWYLNGISYLHISFKIGMIFFIRNRMLFIIWNQDGICHLKFGWYL